MTGFAAVAAELPGVALAVELRSRQPPLSRPPAPPARRVARRSKPRCASALLAELKRGKVECRISLDRTGGRRRRRWPSIRARVEQLAKAAADVPRHAPGARAAVGRRDPALARRAGRADRRRPTSSPRTPRRLVGAGARRARRVARPRRREARGDARGALRRHRGAGRARRAAHSGHPRRLSSRSSARGCGKPGSIPIRTG